MDSSKSFSFDMSLRICYVRILPKGSKEVMIKKGGLTDIRDEKFSLTFIASVL